MPPPGFEGFVPPRKFGYSSSEHYYGAPPVYQVRPFCPQMAHPRPPPIPEYQKSQYPAYQSQAYFKNPESIK
jgi:hypothetical protein